MDKTFGQLENPGAPFFGERRNNDQPETNSQPKFPKISVEVQKSISGEKIEKGWLSKKNIRYLEPQYLLFLKVNPLNTRPFQSKTRVMLLEISATKIK